MLLPPVSIIILTFEVDPMRSISLTFMFAYDPSVVAGRQVELDTIKGWIAEYENNKK